MEDRSVQKLLYQKNEGKNAGDEADAAHNDVKRGELESHDLLSVNRVTAECSVSALGSLSGCGHCSGSR